MTYAIQAAPREHFPWLAKRAGCAITTDFNAIEAMDAHGRIRGMVGYDSWAPNSVQMHAAVESPTVWRKLLRAAFEYPFAQCHVGICLGVIPTSKARSLRFAQAVGFKEMYRVKDGWTMGDDLVVLELRRENCRFVLSDEKRAA